MAELIGNAIFGQSGGPTAVINASASGVILECLEHSDRIPKIYGAANGIVGMLNEQLYDMGEEDPYELRLLKTTPSSALGSCRYKLADAADDDTDYKRLLDVFKKYDIRYFFYNGGNDSMDTCLKVGRYMEEAGYEMRVMGVPKTIDNDLAGSDHSPGFSSAAKYLATSTMEIYQDAHVYDTPMITVLEVMGRDAGWLAGSTVMASHKGAGPDLIYLPEVPFDLNKMVEDTKRIFEQTHNVIIAISEGVKTVDGLYIPELVGELKTDSFGHKQMGGTAQVLANYLQVQFGGVKVRGIEFSLLQRSASHLASRSDVDEAFNSGVLAVDYVLEGHTGEMVAVKRVSSTPYIAEYVPIKLEDVANHVRLVPREWINEEGNFVTQEFLDYVMPLIEHDSTPPKMDGLPRYARLRKVLAKPPVKS